MLVFFGSSAFSTVSSYGVSVSTLVTSVTICTGGLILFSSAQSCLTLWLSATCGLLLNVIRLLDLSLLNCLWLLNFPALQASLSITNYWSLLKLMSIKSVMPSNNLIHCRPLLLFPSIFPSIRVFSNESVLELQLHLQPFQWIFRTDFL